MEFARITNRQALDALWPVLDEDISAVQEAEDMEREQAEVDRLIESVDRDLAAEGRRAAFRLAHDSGDCRWVRRSRRRGERHAVRSLPTRLSARELAAEDVELGRAA